MDERSAEAAREGESLADLVYRARLSEGSRRASPKLTIPLTLAGYLVLGCLVWWAVRRPPGQPVVVRQTIDVDLADSGERAIPKSSPPPAPAPSPAAPAGAPAGPGRGPGGPPPGALLRADAPPPPLPANPDAVPDKPPAALPSQDLSGTAFPNRPSGAPGSAGTGSGPGGGGTGEGNGTSGSGTGSEAAPIAVHYEKIPVKIKYQPPDPPYPPLAKMANVKGSVVLELTIGIDGVPMAAHATQGPRMLYRTAELSAMQWRFEPKKENGVPVIATWPMTFNFQLTEPVH